MFNDLWVIMVIMMMHVVRHVCIPEFVEFCRRHAGEGAIFTLSASFSSGLISSREQARCWDQDISLLKVLKFFIDCL